tara:strand:- start:310 stop:549 length:240 start_codon:yes stop_codon:yes gene_type:complete
VEGHPASFRFQGILQAGSGKQLEKIHPIAKRRIHKCFRQISKQKLSEKGTGEVQGRKSHLPEPGPVDRLQGLGKDQDTL